MEKLLQEILSKESILDQLICIRKAYSNLVNDQHEQLRFIKALAAMHNKKEINLLEILEESMTLENRAFFTYQMIGAALLEYLDSPIAKIFEFCLKFNKHSGTDGAAWTSLNALEKLCALDQSKSKELFSIITAKPKEYKNYLAFGLRILSKHDFETSRNYIVSQMMIDHDMITDALFCIGRLHFHSTVEVNYFIKTLGTFCSEASDENLARILDSACSIHFNGLENDNFENLIDLIQNNSNIGNHVAYTASTQLFLNNDKLTKPILIKFIDFIKYCKEGDFNTLKNFGYFISKNLENDLFLKCLNTLEYFLIKNTDIEISHFGISYNLHSKINVLNKIVTKWYLSNNINLQLSATELVRHAENLNLSPDFSITNFPKHGRNYFLTRKVVGWLYSQDETISHFLINIINQASNNELDNILEFVFDNFLVDYNGKSTEIFLNEDKYQHSSTKNKILALKEKHQRYYELLKNTSYIKELYVPLAYREAHYRLEHKKMRNIDKLSRSQSTLANLFTTQVLLYGNSSIYHIQNGSGTEHRQEMQLGSHSYSIEVPRRTVIDSEGLELNLRILRAEKYNHETNT